MTRKQIVNMVVVVLIVATVLVLSYLMRNTPVPPDCRTNPEACEQPR